MSFVAAYRSLDVKIKGNRANPSNIQKKKMVCAIPFGICIHYTKIQQVLYRSIYLQCFSCGSEL